MARPGWRPLDGIVAGVVGGAIIVGTIHQAPADPTTAATTTAAPETVVTTTTTTTTLPASSALVMLRVDDVRTDLGYSRHLFPTWLDLDGNGCDARNDTLAVESLTLVEREGCTVTSGTWLSVYDGATVTNPGELDIDHVVPLADAWRSGVDEWDPDRRARYANHLDDPDHLIAVTSASNRSKGDAPPNVWRPPSPSSWCRYATAWVRVKITWDLSATTAERDALGQMLDTC